MSYTEVSLTGSSWIMRSPAAGTCFELLQQTHLRD